MENQTHNWRFLSGSWLKVLAVVTMLIDHLAAFIWCNNPEFQTVLFTVRSHPVTGLLLCRMVGRLAFPLFAFLLVEGFLHTRNRTRYGLSLFILALLSEIPWNLVHTGTLLCPRQNVMFTLLLGFLGLCALERYKDNTRYMALSILGLFVIAFFGRADYGYVGYAFVLLLYTLRHHEVVRAVVGCAALPSHVIGGMAFVPIAFYNGKRGFIKGPVLKYLFYAFYPLHLLVIWLLK
jgi:hypothetical protein